MHNSAVYYSLPMRAEPIFKKPRSGTDSFSPVGATTPHKGTGPSFRRRLRRRLRGINCFSMVCFYQYAQTRRRILSPARLETPIGHQLFSWTGFFPAAAGAFRISTKLQLCACCIGIADRKGECFCRTGAAGSPCAADVRPRHKTLYRSRARRYPACRQSPAVTTAASRCAEDLGHGKQNRHGISVLFSVFGSSC